MDWANSCGTGVRSCAPATSGWSRGRAGVRRDCAARRSRSSPACPPVRRRGPERRPTSPGCSATKAALHSFTESLRVQLADTPVQVIEVAPPGVRTGLMGQQDNEQAMPLDEFLTEALALLEADPAAQEIVVEGAEFARDAVANGSYDQVLAMLGGSKA
ncbi:SDR family NAD(P)-dependent oxidoreductase [Amycolatopsis mediterranei]